VFAGLVAGFVLQGSVQAGDWPMWRHDAARGASTPDALPDAMEWLWSRELPPARTAWPKTQKKLQFDTAPQPVVMGKRVFVPSTVNDSVSAYETESGELQWRFFADGPVRFAPAGHEGRVYFVSDDGHLYCVDAETGELEWKVNGGPAERRVLGNHRLVSTWPARGGPVVHGGRVYFCASIWSFMGIFVHAVDAASGEIVWTNSGDGMNYTVQPHGAPSFASVVPQGHLAVSGDSLVVPGGRSTPAAFDLATGRMRHFVFDKKNGGHEVMASGDLYFVAGGAYSVETGQRVSNENPRVAGRDTLVFEDGKSIYGRSAKAKVEKKTVKDRKGKKSEVREYVRETQFAIGPRDGPSKVFIKAGDRVYTAGDGKVAAYEVSGAKGDRKPAWLASIEGTVHHMLAADEKLFVVTEEGGIHCFGKRGAGSAGGIVHRHEVVEPPASRGEGDRFAKLIKGLMEEPEIRKGYGMALGFASGRLVAELLDQSDLHLVILDRSAEKVDMVRRGFDKSGNYGVRVSAHVGDIGSTGLPPYFASLIVCEDLTAAGFGPGKRDFVEKMFRSLRPYGGMAVMPSTREQHAGIGKAVEGLEQARIEWADGVTRLVREGALPGSGDWTHQYANPEQTAISKDKLVKAPLGLLWFGGPDHEGVLPRHGHGPSPQVAGGRLFIEGADMLRAVDVYTGRMVWQRELKGFGTYYNTTAHFAGAGEIGSNYVSLPDRVYAVHDARILELDAATGETLKAFALDGADGDGGRAPHWGYIGAEDRYLIATSSPVSVSVSRGNDANRPKPAASGRMDILKLLRESKYASGSRRLVVYDRHSGELLWKRDAALNFRHNNISVSGETIFCIDSITEAKLNKAGGVVPAAEPTLYALDLKTGAVRWKTSENVFGTFLNYSAEHDILLQAGSKFRDRAADDIGKGMLALRGTTGEVVWHDPEVQYGGPCLLWRDRIITNGNGGFALDLLTGKPTGWSYQRMYGCNTAIGSEHLLTFRSGAAGFYDMESDGGTGNIGGFRSSCTANLIAADGVLSAPDYTRTCSCAYQNQTSLALVHMPEVELWTFGAKHATDRIGVNFGAPGDRRDGEGTLWVDFPSVGGPSSDLEVSVEPARPAVFRAHSSVLGGAGPKWVAASGLSGVESISIPLEGEASHRVRLVFAEPDKDAKAGDRVMEVALQGETVVEKLDVAAEAGGALRPMVREFEARPVEGRIVIGLRPLGASPTVISGVEVVRK
jgi:outer membrane protein assembly factor BamB